MFLSKSQTCTDKSIVFHKGRQERGTNRLFGNRLTSDVKKDDMTLENESRRVLVIQSYGHAADTILCCERRLMVPIPTKNWFFPPF